MKRLLKNFVSVFAVLVIVFSVVAVPVSAELIGISGKTFNYDIDDIKKYDEQRYNEIVEFVADDNNKFNYDSVSDLKDLKYIAYSYVDNTYSDYSGRTWVFYSFLSNDAAIYAETNDFYVISASRSYNYLCYYKSGVFYFSSSGLVTNSKLGLFYLYKSTDYYLSSSWNYEDVNEKDVLSYPDSRYENRDTKIVYDNIYTNVIEKKSVDIKVNVDSVSNTLPVSVDLSENPDFYIDITNNTENAIQFVAWISDTPASSGAYNSYSRLNWTYSKQQWAYVYHGTWGDSARNVLDIYGQVVDTVDLIGLAWWKDVLIDGIDNVLPNSYYSQDNLSSPFHYVEGFGGTFKQKFSFNTATLSKNKEYYFNIVYRPIVQIKVDDKGYGTYWLPTDVVFHDNFTDLDYYELGYCTAFSLGADTVPDGSVSVDYPSDFNTTVINTKSPSATMGNDGTITVSGGSNDLNNSINFSPKIDNSNYNGGVTINNNLGGSGSGAGSYGDFDGDVSQLNKLLHTCTSFFGFLKAGLTAFIPSESIFIVLFSSGMLIVIFLRIWGR